MVSERSVLSRQTNASPSSPSCQIERGLSGAGGRPAPGTRTSVIASADRAKPTAVAHSVASAPTSPMSSPPIPGPTRNATLNTASWIPFTCSRRRPAASAVSGSIASRAVAPAGSNTAPSAATTTSSQSERTSVAAAIGTAATLTMLSTSDPIEVRRRPTRSTIVPEANAESTSGSEATAATRPASAALPVRSRTTQGNATSATPFPAAASSVAVSSATKGRQLWVCSGRPYRRSRESRRSFRSLPCVWHIGQ